MLKLLTCARGHFWESPDDPSPERPVTCPECGAPADHLPLLDLAPSELAKPLPPPVAVIEPDLFDADGRPNVAGFEVREDLGRSISGVRLYRARQQLVNRDVLLEVVAARQDSREQGWGSLRGEASALGKLSHPNIIQIHEAGERDRQLFYNAVELIEGPTLAQKTASKPLPFDQVVRLTELLARAIDHAHERDVLHRNLRPSLVRLQPIVVDRETTLGDDPSGAVCQLHSGFFIPKLTGFGLPRRPVEGDAIDADLFGDEAGFLSPEQAWGRSKDLGPNTDVYGLGGILYFLLTGRPPFRGPSLTDILDAIQTADLVRPSAMRSIPADLEAICRKCLMRQPRRRYASARELADDLSRVRRRLPIRASHPPAAARLGRWVRRRPALAALLLVCVLGFFSTIIAYNIGASDAEDTSLRGKRIETDLGNARMEANNLRAEINEVHRFMDLVRYKQKLDAAQGAIVRGDRAAAQSILDSCPVRDRGFEWHYLKVQTEGRGTITLDDFQWDISAAAIGGPEGRFVTTVQPGPAREPPRRVGLWDLPARKQVLSWPGRLPGPVHALAFSPDGRRLATAGGHTHTENGELRVFSLVDGPQRGDLMIERTFPGSRLTDVAYTSGQIIVARGNGLLSRLDSATGNFVHVQFGQMVGLRGGQLPFTRIGVDSAGTIASSTDGGEVHLYQANQVFDQQPSIEGAGDVLAMAVEGNLLAVARADRSIRFRRSNPLNQIRPMNSFSQQPDDLTDLPQPAVRLAFGPDGQRLAAVMRDDSVRVWGLAGDFLVELLSLRGGPGKVALAFSSSGKVLMAAGPRKVVVWGEIAE
jgi:hypothetical protein